jgi:hypothetical protein
MEVWEHILSNDNLCFDDQFGNERSFEPLDCENAYESSECEENEQLSVKRSRPEDECEACGYEDIFTIARSCAKLMRLDVDSSQPSLQDFLYAKDVCPIEFDIYGEHQKQYDQQTSACESSVVAEEDKNQSESEGESESESERESESESEIESESEGESESDGEEEGKQEGDEEEMDDENDQNSDYGAADDVSIENIHATDSPAAMEPEACHYEAEHVEAEHHLQDTQIVFEGEFFDFGIDTNFAATQVGAEFETDFFHHADCMEDAAESIPADQPISAAPLVGEETTSSGSELAVLQWISGWAEKLAVDVKEMEDRALRILSTPASFAVKFKQIPLSFQRVFRKFNARISTAITPFHGTDGILSHDEIFVAFSSTQKDHRVCSTVDWLRVVARSAFPGDQGLDASLAVEPIGSTKFVLPHTLAMRGVDLSSSFDAIVRGVSEMRRFDNGCSFSVHFPSKAADAINSIIDECFLPIRLRAESSGHLVRIFLDGAADLDIETAKLQLAFAIYKKSPYISERRIELSLAYGDIQKPDVIEGRKREEKLGIRSDAVRVARQISDWCTKSDACVQHRNELFAIAHIYLYSSFAYNMPSLKGWDSHQVGCFVQDVLAVDNFVAWKEIIRKHTNKNKITYAKVGTHLNCSGTIPSHTLHPLASFSYLIRANPNICERCVKNVCPYDKTYYGPVQSLRDIEFETGVHLGSHFAYFFK